MIIIGAKGLAKQILPLLQNAGENEVSFFDDINLDIKTLANYEVISDKELVRHIFQNKDDSFVIGIGNPLLRKKLCEDFEQMEGKLISLIDSSASVSSIETKIEEGVLILQQVIIEPFVSVGKGTLVNIGAKICHDSVIGNFCEIGPGVVVTGNCTIGNNTSLGASVTVVPNVNIGNNCVVGAGAVVISDIPDNCTAVGMPAKIIKVK